MPSSPDPWRHLRPAGLALLVAASVAACTSVPLGPLPPRRDVGIASPPPPGALAPAPAASAASAASAVASPVSAPELVPAIPLSAAPAASAPYGPAVAARFPDPPVEFQTPAFRPDHPGFTTNAELHDVLVGLVRDSTLQRGSSPVRLLVLGTSQRGVPLEALLFARSPLGAATPASDRVDDYLVPGRPTVLLVGEQHGDEPAGAEALIVIAQELAHGRYTALLDRINVVVFPRANPDGAELGQRASANGIDINRDHLLLRTPEAQAQARLVREFKPAVVVDAHEYTVVGHFLEKFNAVQRFDALMQYATTANIAPFVERASEEWFRQPAVARLKAAGLTSEWYYTASDDPADRQITMGGTQPDTGRNVDGLTNAVSLLVETRGVGVGRLHLKRRVYTQVTAIGSFLDSAARRADDLVKLRQYVDQEVSSQACQGDVVVEAAPTQSEYSLLMLDPETGADKEVTVTWNSALALEPLKVRKRPCGYWLSANETDAVQHLRALGVQVLRFEQGGEIQGEAYRETLREVAPRDQARSAPDDAGPTLRIKVQTLPALVDLAIGSYYVPLSQPLANLAVAALEPDTPFSYYANRVVTSLASEARLLLVPLMKAEPVP